MMISLFLLLIPILNPDLAEQTTRAIKLDNGLQAFLISDPRTSQSAAAMTVATGSWSDPDELLGLAHFTEHMLFLGSHKYPNEGEFSQFITANGGTTNAYTSTDYTAYMFDIQNEAFPEALDRFAENFKSPLFNASGVNREMNAVDQEYQKNKNNDDFRAYLVFKGLSKANHPQHRFTIGSLETLANANPDVLRQWHHAHYGANLMRLVVLSNQSLDTLEKEVRETFSSLSTHAISLPFSQTFSDPIQGKWIVVEPIQESQSLTVIWEIPPALSTLTPARADNILTFLLGYEGKGSLLAYLKEKGLAEKLSAGFDHGTLDDQILFIEIGLTDKGVNQLEDVGRALFQQIRLINTLSADTITNIQKIYQLNYQYQVRKDPFDKVTDLARKMPYEDFATFPEHSELITENNPAPVKALAEMLQPTNAIYLLEAQPQKSGWKTPDKEQWLGARYGLYPAPEGWLKNWAEASSNAALVLPISNPFVPASFPEKPASASTYIGLPAPVLLDKTARSHFYYGQDHFFQSPQSAFTFTLKSPHCLGKPSLNAMADLICKLVEERLKTVSYDADLVKIKSELEAKPEGIVIKVEGFTEGAFLLAHQMLEAFQLKEISSDELNSAVESLRREYQAKIREMPIQQIFSWFKETLYLGWSSYSSRVKALKQVSPDKLENFIAQFHKKGFVQGMAYGSLSLAQAKGLQSASENIFVAGQTPSPLPFRELSEEEGPHLLKKETPTQGNAALLYISCDPFSLKRRTVHALLGQMLKDPFYNELRTRQQTGYLIYSTAEEIERHLLLIFSVQSSLYDPRDLIARFELFLETFALSPELFEAHRNAQVIQLQQPPKNPRDMVDILNKLAFNLDGDFTWIDQRMTTLKALTFEEFSKTAKSFLIPANRKRLAFLLYGTTENCFPYTLLPNLKTAKKS